MVAIGGVGGSGTRVIAQILQDLGYFMGEDLNESNDTLLYTLLFKRQNILTLSEPAFDDVLNLFVKIMATDKELSSDENDFLKNLAAQDRTLHAKEWLQKRAEFTHQRATHLQWGWKEPNTHIIIEKLFSRMEDLKFIYVYRNGLDMAYSENQNQLKLWGSIFFNEYNIDINPKNSLRYWCITHKRMLELKNRFASKVFMLDFDKLCLSPEETLQELALFLEYKKNILEFTQLIKVPSSIGRYKQFPLSQFDKKDLEFISEIYKR